MMKKDWVYRRGDIYYADLNPVCGSEQGGKRPVVVIQNNIGNAHSPTLIVATITTKQDKRNYPTHYPIKENPAFTEPSMIMLEQLRTIDKNRVIGYLGKIAAKDMVGVDRALIAPDMELTVITLDEAPDILPCFDEDDAYLNIPDSSLLLSYNPAQVLKLAGKHYLTGLVILVRTNMDGGVISLTIDEVYLFQKYLASHSITLMADDQKLPCICME